MLGFARKSLSAGPPDDRRASASDTAEGNAAPTAPAAAALRKSRRSIPDVLMLNIPAV
jgi:hypothetical protein